MSFFSKILDTLGLGAAEAKKPHPVPEARDSGPATESRPKTHTSVAEPTPKPVSEVDVVAKLETLAAANPQKLNWKSSIVDLLKLLGIDSSYGARKELAAELGCPAEFMEESAKMNVWLHKTVLRKIAENGGNVPADLLD
ncbi:MAG: DUF3597 domain-containing protein [Gammaproteobacteria bacterium]|jgi:hypothetical protein